MSAVQESNAPVPEFIAASDLAISRLIDIYGKDKRISGLCFFGQRFHRNNVPYDFCRVSAFGTEAEIIETMTECFKLNHHALEMMTKAWFNTYLDVTADQQQDPIIREQRRILLRLIGKNPDGTAMSPADEARAMADQIKREHPEREVAIRIMKQQSKKYRQSGLNDMRIVMDQCIADTRLQMAQDEQRILMTEDEAVSIAANLELEAEYNRQQIEEARRVKSQLLADRLDEAEIQHDYEQALRRAKTRREFIERMTAEAERIEAEARSIEASHPQFNVQAAAKARRKKIAARQHERNACKKKGKEPDSCSPLFG